MGADDGRPRVFILHGPNLNLLGKREPEIYGSTTLTDIDANLIRKGREWNLTVETFQSNHEGALVDRIQSAMAGCDGVIINPAAYTHTSVAIRDALLALSVPIIEIHLSNIYKRETFRHHSLIRDIATGQIAGCGAYGYELALLAMADMLQKGVGKIHSSQ